ncbi:sugar transferase [Paeniroseomonas aquatica]|uniref:Sugar transferase n=1 Tax=Paeniroseomonas aquatica TaxID=373043 RepID=A0ABT8AA20_9PROT|nr:sugar transferase [Paeniroseomonas aquatica]MDN3566368.1 sugar transferase [Paeniroseomonas aquatica]
MTDRRGLYARGGKRLFDLLGAAVLLVLLAPLLALAAGAVLATLGRPVLFRQERAGRGGQGFTLLKFRSMRDGPGSDAERLSGFGRRLRASAVDELPQLLNVLRGEMSLVGPRPLPLAYVALYSPAQAARLRVRPGLAGLAQAAGRNAVPWRTRLALDAWYARRPSFGRDLWLLGRCLLLVVRGIGATGIATPPCRSSAARPNGPDSPPNAGSA